MASGIGCKPGPGEACSNRVAGKAASVSRHDIVSLRTPRDFRRVLKEGKRKTVGGIVLVAAPAGQGPPRVGLTVSKSIGSAVTRNRVKRRLRHTVRDVQLQPAMDYVIIARQSIVDASYPTLMGWLGRAIEELPE